MVSLVANPVEFGLSYNFESLGSVISAFNGAFGVIAM
jgi:hypothetical protein